MKPAKAVLLGSLVMGTLEAIETSTFWWFYRGIDPWRIFRFIAMGLFGPGARQGGLPATAAGILIHYFNAIVIVAVYLAASRFLPVLVRRPVVCGLLYGAAVHLVMAYVVIPLSAIPSSDGPTPLLHIVHSLVSQAVTVGLPSAYFARAARPPGTGAPAGEPVPA